MFETQTLKRKWGLMRKVPEMPVNARVAKIIS